MVCEKLISGCSKNCKMVKSVNVIAVFFMMALVLSPAAVGVPFVDRSVSYSAAAVTVSSETGYKITLDKIFGWILTGAVKEILKKHGVTATSLKYDIDVETKFGLDMKLKIKATINLEVKESVSQATLDKIRNDIKSAIRSLAKLATFSRDDEERLNVKVENVPSLTQKNKMKITIDALYD